MISAKEVSMEKKLGKLSPKKPGDVQAYFVFIIDHRFLFGVLLILEIYKSAA